MIGRGDMDTGNGGGVTLPTNNLDFINNLFSNVGDPNQFGNSGNIWQWTSGSGSNYTAVCTHSGTAITCLAPPFQTDLTSPAHVSAITIDSSHNVTIAHGGIRLDPTLCPGSSATCIANGQTIVVGSGICNVGATVCLTAGSYAMTGTTGNWNGGTDGTGGVTIVYNDGASVAGTVCSTLAACNTAFGSNTMTFASLGGKMLDISVGDGVYALDTGDGTCTSGGYLTGSTVANYAIAGTVPTGLTVKYNLATAPTAASANCFINNGAGLPRFVTVQNNTFLTPNNFAIDNFAQWHQPISNWLHDNVWANNNPSTSLNSDVYALSPSGEGTTAFESWDSASFQFYHNVMQGRNSANWSVVNCPGGTCTNSFPSTVSSFFTGTYPSGSCPNASAPFNCPLMALPWANNFSLSNLVTSTQGVNPAQLTNAMTQTKYVCPVGASCGTHGPYPD
jgi:hypothetical protein